MTICNFEVDERVNRRVYGKRIHTIISRNCYVLLTIWKGGGSLIQNVLLNRIVLPK